MGSLEGSRRRKEEGTDACDATHVWAGQETAVPERLCKKEHMADALALRAEERRDKLRKAPGRGTYPEIRRYLNGGTHMRKPHVSMRQSITHGREPGELKHLSSRRKRKQQ